jgi:hypothetical protein
MPNEYEDKTIVISQSKSRTYKTNISDIGIYDLKTYYDNVYYSETKGNLRSDIPVYNGDGTSWTKIN